MARLNLLKGVGESKVQERGVPILRIRRTLPFRATLRKTVDFPVLLVKFQDARRRPGSGGTRHAAASNQSDLPRLPMAILALRY
jgi:hypothetical protein